MCVNGGLRMETGMDSATTDGTAERLCQFIKKRFPLKAGEQLTDDLPLLETGVVDSLGILDLVAFIEDEFGVAADDDDLIPENFETIQSMARFVGQRR